MRATYGELARRLASPRAVSAAEEILQRWTDDQEGRALDRIVNSELRGRRYLNSSERRWIGDAVFGAVRYWRRDSWILGRQGCDSDSRARIAMWVERTHIGVFPETNADSGLPGPDRPLEYLRESLAFPDSLASALEAQLGEEAPAAGAAFNRPAPTMLRVNTLRANRQAVLERLAGSAPSRYSPWGVELQGRANVADLPGFREGWFEVQEEASQLIALLTAAKPGQTVADVGAGGGGKSLAFSAMMQNDGIVLAIDTSEERLSRLETRAKRAGATIIRPISLCADAEGRWQLSRTKQRRLDKNLRSANCVLVDAPCSGSGVLRRSPDAKWRAPDPDHFTRLQSLILQQSSDLVAATGTLIYATCAFEREQNEGVVEGFLGSKAGSAFQIAPALPRLERSIRQSTELASTLNSLPPADLESLFSGPFLRTWPHRHGLDAFFAACFVRRF